METKLLVCLFLVAAASAGPVVRNYFDDELPLQQCARQCRANPVKFDYQPGKTYVYEYETEADTLMAGASEEKARMRFQIKAHIDVTSQCEHALHLKDIRVFHSEPGQDYLKRSERVQEFQRDLTAQPLRYSFDDGIISDVCHSSSEKIWVLNFKRGFLSAFQNSLEDFELKGIKKIKEVDVSGECDAKYSSGDKDWWFSNLRIKKTKNLLACYQRSSLKTLIPMVPHQSPSDIQSLPLMKSSHECEQEMKDKMMVKSVCKESHVFAPFSNHQSGARTDIKQTLTFKSSMPTAGSMEMSVDVRSNLLFQHVQGNDKIQNSRVMAEKKMNELCDQTKTEVRPETPRRFTELVQIVKQMDQSDLKQLYRRIKDRRICRDNEKGLKFFLDTLPVARTSGTVELMVDVINKDEISDVEKQIWLTSLSIIPAPTKEMLQPLFKLLNGRNAEQALLPISVVLNTLCKKDVECDKHYYFQSIVNKINENIAASCSSDDRSLVLRTLRAIGNIGYGQNFVTSLTRCIQSRYTPLEVKVAAVDSFRRFPCQNEEETRPLFEVFESQAADAELRIMSFISLMRCPSERVLTRITEQLNTERDTNVGTFVYSYLKNLMKTSDPHKQDIREAVRHLSLKPFEGDWKSSRNFESSALLNEINIGYVADADLIWSQSSVTPRSLRVNLTVEMFGNSINFFEAGARANGLDQFVERYFGSSGYFSSDKTKTSDLEAFIYARMFGNELFFKNVKGTEEFQKLKSKLNFDTLLESISKEYDYKYSHTQQLLDDSFIIPTTIGLPVNLTINSTVTVSAEAQGNVDLSGFLAHLKPIGVSADLTASAAFELTGSMMVDALWYRQGVRMRNTLHSSVHVKSNLLIKDGKIFSFDVETPEEKQELFDARSQFFVVHDSIEKEQEMIKENREEMQWCTGKSVAKWAGIELCGDVQYPNASTTKLAPYFPFSGPARATLVLKKVDTQRSYKIFAKWIKNARKLEAQLLLDTPGSRVDRHISADLTVGMHKNPHIDVILRSPWKKIVVNGKAAKSQELVALVGSVVVDDQRYKLTSEVKIEKDSKKRFQYTPLVELELDGKRYTFLSGSVWYEQWKEILVALDLKDLNKKPYLLDGHIVYRAMQKKIELGVGQKKRKEYIARVFSTTDGRNKRSISVQALLQTPRGNIVEVNSISEFQLAPFVVKAGVTVDAKNMKRPVVFKVDIGQKRHSLPVKVKIDSPIFEGKLQGKIDLRQSNYVALMKMDYKTPSSKDRITLATKIQNRSKPGLVLLSVNSKMRFQNNPQYNSLTTMEVYSKKKSSVELNIRYGKNPNNKDKQIRVVASVNSDISFKKPSEAQLEAMIEAKAPEKDVDLSLHLGHAHSPKKLDSEIKVRLIPFIKNDVIVGVFIESKDKSTNLLSAEANLQAAGEEYSFKSDLVKKSKNRYDHSITVSKGESEHSVLTKFQGNINRLQIVSTLKSMSIERPLMLEVSTVLKKPSDFRIKGSLSNKRQQLYSLAILSKFEQDVAGKWNLIVSHPDRKIKAEANFRRAEDTRVIADAKVNWNADSRQYPSPQVEISCELAQSVQYDSSLYKTNIEINTPFKGFEKLNSNINLEKSEKELKSAGKISWGRNQKQITSQISAQLPISIKRTKFNFVANTGYRHLRDIEIEVDHSMDFRVKTKVRGKLGKDESELILDAEKDFTDWSHKLEGSVQMKTPYHIARNVGVTVKYSNDEDELKAILNADRNGQSYGVKLDSSSNSNYHRVERKGKLVMSGPEKSTKSEFVHQLFNGKHIFQASVDSYETHIKQISFDISGSYKDINHAGLNASIEIPRKSIDVQFNHQIDSKQVKSKCILEIDHSRSGYDVSFETKQGRLSSEIHLLPPNHLYEHDVSLTSKVKYGRYPVKINSQIKMSPDLVINIKGSLELQRDYDMELEAILQTPFKGYEEMHMVASNLKKDSNRVLHLNLAHNSRRLADIEILGKNDERNKMFSLKTETPKLLIQKLETGFDFYTNKGIAADIIFSMQKSSQDESHGLNAHLKVSSEDSMSFNINIKTPFEEMKNFKMQMSQNTDDQQRTVSLITNLNDLKIIDVTAESVIEADQIKMKTTVQGEMLYVVIERMTSLSFIPKIDKDANGNKIKELILQLQVDNKDKITQLDASMTADYVTTLLEPSIKIRKSGESLNDIDINVLISNGKEALEGIVVLKLVDDIRIQALLKDRLDSKHGVEYSHTQNSNKDEIKGRLYLNKLHDFESSIDLLISSIRHVELIATSRSSYRGFEVNKLKYTHEGQDNRISCSASMEDIIGVIASVEVVSQSSPVNMLSIIVNTPVDGLTKIVVNADYDNSKVNGLIKLNDNEALSISVVHDNLRNPEITLRTPYRQLKQITVNLEGKLSDASVDFLLKFNEDDQMDGNFLLNYQRPTQMAVKAKVNSRLDGTKDKLNLEVEYQDKPKKISHLLLSMNERNKFKYDLKQNSQSSDPSSQLNLQVHYPGLELSTQGFVLDLNGNKQKALGKVQLLNKDGKMLDADLNLDIKAENKASLIVHQPTYMEYKFTREHSTNTEQNELSFNWDRNDPKASVAIRSLMKDESNSQKMDKSFSLSFTCPIRSVGVEHAVFASDKMFKSSGKVFWNKERDSEVFYELELRDDRYRMDTSYYGDMKIRLPMRTIAVSGKAKDDSYQQQAETVLSWDLDRDSSKKVGVKGTLAKGDYTQADFSITLPKDAHVDSKLVLNKGNTILEGQTRIFYSDDSRKTLTLFSKLENQPSSRSFFYRAENQQNYSMQFGMSHPVSRIDMKMVSHLAMNDDRFTTSIGLDYLTSRRQTKNMDLFLEINKLKKEINVFTNTPYQNYAVSAAVKSQDPLELRLATSIDGQEHLDTSLKVNPDEKSIQVNLNNAHRRLIYQASIPKKTSFKLVGNRYENGHSEQDFNVLVQLPFPGVLQTIVHWRPGMFANVRQAVKRIMTPRAGILQELIDEIARDLEIEVTGKYKDITDSLVVDTRDVINAVIAEVVLIEEDIEQLQQDLHEEFDICDVEIGQFALKEDVVFVRRKIALKVERLAKVVKTHSSSYKNNLHSWSKSLQKVQNRHPKQFYSQVKQLVADWEYDMFKSSVFRKLQSGKRIPQERVDDLWEYVDEKIMQRQWDPTPLIDSMNKHLEASLNKTISSTVGRVMQSNTRAVSKLKELFRISSKTLTNNPVSDMLVSVLENFQSELYQLAKWSVNYWNLGEVVSRRLENLLNVINRIVDEEIRQQVESSTIFLSNPVTKFDSEQGVFQARVPLIIPIDRLDEMPSVSKIASQLQQKYGNKSLVSSEKINTSRKGDKMDLTRRPAGKTSFVTGHQPTVDPSDNDSEWWW